MPVVGAAPVDSDTFTKLPTAAMATSTQRASEPVAGSETQIRANAEESNRGRSERAHNTNYGIPHKERKRSFGDTGGQQAKRQAVSRGARPSSNERVHASGIRKRNRAPANPALKAQRKGGKRPFTQGHFIGHIRPVREPSKEVIVISSDNDDDDEDDEYYARFNWQMYQGEPEGGILPTDSHQDDIVVNSTELEQDGVAVGITHYIESLNKQKSYETISTTFDHYRTNGRDLKDLPNLDRYRDECPAERPDSSIDYTKPPRRNINDDISRTIHYGWTCNTLVCIAIIRVAQMNLPFINFDSALNNLANLHPTDPFPQLPELSIFVDDVDQPIRDGDESIVTVFIPDYYRDGRHAIGFFVEHSTGPMSCLFTPCSDMDMQRLGLIKVEGEDRGFWQDAKVATNCGCWFDKTKYPDEWLSLLNFVILTWGGRQRLIMGGREDP